MCLWECVHVFMFNFMGVYVFMCLWECVCMFCVFVCIVLNRKVFRSSVLLYIIITILYLLYRNIITVNLIFKFNYLVLLVFIIIIFFKSIVICDVLVQSVCFFIKNKICVRFLLVLIMYFIVWIWIIVVPTEVDKNAR